ncbi:winged helix-turn-helix domain-containing protein [Mangrovicella endophytica]|uniref:winged helix-turn-helix domain-containing protein n=1 Tax=Mangrovicella endophytica TaxID=2066697 RepID=UPI000C9E6F12|nr:winged helix-turn-helix domain-containing protein [Mangrovicella endophytica]
MTDETGAALTHFRITLANGAAIGPGKAKLLETIAATGSIAAAGRSMKMSYKRAWLLVEALNRSFPSPLVEPSRGGRNKGGAVLTEVGQDVLHRYRAIEDASRKAAADHLRALGSHLQDDMSSGK